MPDLNFHGQYPAKYIDAHGSEWAIIHNDGTMLKLTLRGVEFAGSDFDSLEPVGAYAEQLQRFTLSQNCLCSCQIECQIPVPVHDNSKLLDGVLAVELLLGNPSENGGIDRLQLRIVLEYNGQRFISPRTSGLFEEELLAIQSQLPAGVYFKACINCLYSDYSPFGNGLFGYMMCFRNLKEEYLKVKSKGQFWSVHGRHELQVQETCLCPEFERRLPGTGYRG